MKDLTLRNSTSRAWYILFSPSISPSFVVRREFRSCTCVVRVSSARFNRASSSTLVTLSPPTTTFNFVRRLELTASASSFNLMVPSSSFFNSSISLTCCWIREFKGFSSSTLEDPLVTSLTIRRRIESAMPENHVCVSWESSEEEEDVAYVFLAASSMLVKLEIPTLD